MSDSEVTTRARLREVLNRLFALGVSPLVAAYQIEKRLVSDKTARRLIGSYGGLLALWPGFSGDLLRRAFYRDVLSRMDPSVTISQGASFSSDDIELGQGVYLGGGCVLGRCRIGAHTLLGDYVVVIPGRKTHHYKPNGELDEDRPGDDVPIHIGEHCWIGAHAVIMADVGARSTVGAGAVVVKPIPEGVVAVGNPARPVRKRGADETPGSRDDHSR